MGVCSTKKLVRYKEGSLQDITHQWVLDFRDPASFVKLKNILLGTP